MPSVLKLYVNTNAFPGLKEYYETAAEKHNKSVETNVHCDSGFDMFVPDHQPFKPSQTILVNMGIKAALFSENGTPLPYYIYPRSSIATKTPLRLANSVGIIDSGYRGFLGCVLDCKSDWLVNKPEDVKDEYVLSQYMKVTQICAGDLSFFRVELVDTENALGTTLRGEGGFGSTDTTSNIQLNIDEK